MVGVAGYRRALGVALVVVALAALGLVARTSLSDNSLSVTLPVATGLSLAGGYGSRQVLRSRRASGAHSRTLIVIGSPPDASRLVRRLMRAPSLGFSILGTCSSAGGDSVDVDGTVVPILGPPHDIDQLLGYHRPDAVAVIEARSAEELRHLARRLQGAGIDLLVPPSLVKLLGPRRAERVVTGLSLVHAEESRLFGTHRIFKEGFDRVVAGLMLMVFAPLFAAMVVAFRLSNHGSAFFRQVRVGRHGKHFTVYKFRTMHPDAEVHLTSLLHENEHDGPHFKLKNDPRCTRFGRILRRYSVDELPQLWNVFRGEMSLVGPRPPLPSEVESYDERARRRLLVKPGLTGLWQVSGRSDLSWDEAVRLDLHYVENWSPAMDAAILCRTLPAVISGRGAY